MRSFFIVLSLALALVACNGKKSSTTPTGPTVSGPVTEQAMIAYFKVRFPAQAADGTLVLDFGSVGTAEEVTEELRLLGITDMKGVAALVPSDFDPKGFDAIKASEAPTTNVAALMRDLMIIHDTRGYFEKAWRNKWATSGPQDFPVPAAYGVDFGIMEELGVFTGEGGGDDGNNNPCGGDWGDDNPC